MAATAESNASGPARPWRVALYCAAVVGVGLIAWAQVAIRADEGYLFDFYPLYRGAEALLSRGDAYALVAPDGVARGVEAVGNSYPIHAVLLLGAPLVWLPPDVAVVAWTALVGGGWVLSVWWAGESPYWFLWVPMWQALLLQQPSAAVGVAAIVAWGALRRRAPWVFAASLVVLTVKPQQSLLLMVALAWWGRAWWRQVVAVLMAVAGLSFLAQPDWVSAWIERVAVRAQLVPVVWVWPLLIPTGFLLVLRGWRASGVAILSSGLGPWPTIGGYYGAVAWPLGAGRSQGAALALLGIAGFVAGEVWNGSMAFVVVVGAGVAIAALALPDRRPPPSTGEASGRAHRAVDRG